MSLTDGPSLNPAVRQRSTRDRPAKAPLSEKVVVDAALAILKSDGLDAVTMRRVAAALDTGAASLYVYVSGREGLHRAMLDRITSTIPLEAPDAARWRVQTHSLLSRMHETLVAHPGIAAMTLAHPPTTDAVLLLTENMLGTLLAGGFDPQDAAWTCDILVMLVTAVASEDDVRRAHGDGEDDHRAQIDELHTTFSALPPERFPLLTTYAAQMVTGGGDERFHFAIDVVIDGVLARTTQR
jgi:AcrR family transcriptional regulator